MHQLSKVKKAQYFDSVVLMNVTERLKETDGIIDALVVMATANNKKILTELDMLSPEASSASANDLVVTVHAEDYNLGKNALDQLESYFSQKPQEHSSDYFPTLESARSVKPSANLALISVSGEFAGDVARKALSQELHTIIFSDHVTLEEEAALKRLGTEHGLLVMGPDCGVCNLQGTAFVLASIANPGPVGAVGATGSGLQELSVLINRAGGGISQFIGTGGHDLHPQVGAQTMRTGLALLDNDPATQVIVLIGKAPTPEITTMLCGDIHNCSKPVIACFLGAEPEDWLNAGAYFAPTMEAASRCAMVLSSDSNALDSTEIYTRLKEIKQLAGDLRTGLSADQRYLRGIYGAGTFVAQAQVILQELVSPIYSNVPFGTGIALPNLEKSIQHSLLDIGDETFTLGRAHPVIDPLPYKLQLLKETRDDETAVIIMDVTLGPAMHPNPARYISDAFHEALSRNKIQHRPIVIASITGTRQDPQNADEQARILKEAGIIVLQSSAEAAILAGLIITPPEIAAQFDAAGWLAPRKPSHPTAGNGLTISPSIQNLLRQRLEVINIGISTMADALRDQNVETSQVDWAPPAGGDVKIMRLLEDLEPYRQQIQTANQKAFDTMITAQPVWVDVRAAGEVVPGMKENTVLHAGPPLDFEQMLPSMQGGIIGGILFEGLAKTREEALELIRRGKIDLAPGLDYKVPSGAVASTTYSMPVAVVENKTHNSRGFTALQEGPASDALRWGVYNDAVAKRWKWLKDQLGTALSAALQASGGVDMRTAIARSLQMGDDNHSRELGTNMYIALELAPHLARLDLPREETAAIFEFLRSSERFALHILMASAMSVLSSVEEIEYAAILTAMGGNGVDFGLKISGLGNQWFTSPAPNIEGKYLNPNWTVEDTLPFIGDSCVVEVYGLGGLAAAASPSVAMLMGGSIQKAMDRTTAMWAISVGKNPNYQIPFLGFEGTPTALDMIRILETGIEPQSHAGIALKKGGQAGAGVAHIPMECFRSAFLAFSKKYGTGEQ